MYIFVWCQAEFFKFFLYKVTNVVIVINLEHFVDKLLNFMQFFFLRLFEKEFILCFFFIYILCWFMFFFFACLWNRDIFASLEFSVTFYSVWIPVFGDLLSNVSMKKFQYYEQIFDHAKSVAFIVKSTIRGVSFYEPICLYGQQKTTGGDNTVQFLFDLHTSVQNIPHPIMFENIKHVIEYIRRCRWFNNELNQNNQRVGPSSPGIRLY